MENMSPESPIRFIPAKCPNCGGELRVPDNRESVKCMYCGYDILIYDKNRLVIETKINVERIISLADAAIEAHNYEEAFKYYSKILEQDPNNASAWIGKGISAGAQTSIKQQRLTEALAFIKKGMAIDLKENHHRNYEPVAIILTNSILAYATIITEDIDNTYDAKSPQAQVDPLGAISRNRRREQIIEELSNDFERKYQEVIIQALAFAWQLSDSLEIALNIYKTLNKIKECYILTDVTRATFEQNLRPVLDKIKDKYPTWQPPKAKKQPFCFIATATMSSYDHPYVVILREYRDKRLEQSKFGILFIKAYYQFSPPIAKLIENNLLLKKLSLYLIIKPSVIIATKALSRK